MHNYYIAKRTLIERILRSLPRGEGGYFPHVAAPFLSLRDILPPKGAGFARYVTASLAPTGGNRGPAKRKGSRVRELSDTSQLAAG